MNKGRFGPNPRRSGLFSPGRFSPIFGESFRPSWGGSFQPSFKGGSFWPDIRGKSFWPDLLISGK